MAEALRRAGAEFTVTADPATLLRAERVILPGVGEASSAMARLREKGARHARSRADLPRAGHLHRDAAALPVERGGATPPVWASSPPTWCGFPTVRPTGRSKSPHGLGHRRHAARAALRGNRRADLRLLCPLHAPRLCDAAIAATDYGMRFSAALARDNFFGTQFHPRKERGGGQPDSTQLPNTEMR